MKFVKLSVLALSMGLFVASCGNGSTEAPKTDSAAMAAPAPEAAPAPAATADTAKKDSAAMAAPATTAPAAEPKKEEVKK